MGALTLFGAILVAVGWDWLGVTRLAAYYTDFDYCYWPLSGRRRSGLVALVLVAIFMWVTAGTNAPLWTIIVPACLFAVWGITAIRDINEQRSAGYRKPPRYSDSDY